MLSAMALAVTLQAGPPIPRFQPAAPFPRLPWIRIDQRFAGGSFADDVCRLNDLQGRVLWIDGTANLDKINSNAKIESLLAKIADVGFNTVVLDVKPIVGRTLYPSRYTDPMNSWKGQSMPKGFDPVREFRKVTKNLGLSFFVSLNAFSEGHSYAKRDAMKPDSLFGEPGWGYAHPEHQSVVYKPVPSFRIGLSTRLWSLCPRLNPDRWSEDGALFDKPPLREGGEATFVELDKRLSVVRVGSRPPEGLSPGERILVLTNRAATVVPGNRVSLETTPRYALTSEDQDQIPLMMNPLDPAVQERVVRFVKEVCDTYRPDGLLFDDRFRFHGLDADFSELSRGLFEKHVHTKLRWPDDVYRYTLKPDLTSGIDPGPYFDSWLAWRAGVLARFAAKVRQTVMASSPGAEFGIYAGSWYGDYAKYGSNYASAALSAGFPFLTPLYQRTGFAADLDVLITGCYYSLPTMEAAMKNNAPIGRTVEAAGDISDRVARDQCWVYAGIQLADFQGDTGAAARAIQAAAATTQGVMVFDLSHDIDKYWPLFRDAFAHKARAPHAVRGLLDEVRKRRHDWDLKGLKEKPFPILEGAPGSGF